MTTTFTDDAGKTARIAALNDLARTAIGIACRVVQTPGITALPPAVQSSIRERIETFDAFTPGDDPYGERDFGSIDLPEVWEPVYWKIDYYAHDLRHGSEDPSDPSQTTRVLTVMLASEY